MTEMAHAGEGHGQTALIGRRNDFRVANRTARLNGGRRAGLGGRDQAVREGEEGVAANRAYWLIA